MAFRGLFIGINRYADSRVSWLSGATRDAQALHALFADTFAGDDELLVDEAATADAIRIKLSELAARCTDDDVVVVTYAGHGTEEHQLVTFDADVSNLASTCIPLDELADLLTAIPGRNLLCVLDCCFSGGLGSRVLTPPLRARSVAASVSMDVLDRFVGEGRIVLTASADDEEALESPLHGHGLLTYRVLEALQGVDEVRVGDQLSLYRLIDYVTRSVAVDAARMGYVQTTALRGRLDGTPTWPALTPGASYFALFPNRARPTATADLDSLVPHGVAPEIIAIWKSTIPTLNDLQTAAINEYGILDGASLVVTAPTSSGKTMIGELAAMRNFTERRRTIFLLPMRALVNDKYQQFQRTYGPIGVKTIRATGEYGDSVPEFTGGQFDIALLTYEKFTSLALGSPHLLDLASTVVIDEAQILADNTRGSNLEFLLTMLNNRRGRTGSPQIITLSAVVGDLGGLDVWLGAGHLQTTSRPVALIEGLLDDSGTFRYIDERGEPSSEHGYITPLHEGGSRRLVIPLVKRLVGEGKKIIVFRQSKGEAVACAVYLARALGLPPAADGLSALPIGDTSTSSATLRGTIAQGVAFHNTDLDREERQVIEEEFRLGASALRVICATPTLAMGVNTPASAVVIVGLTHPAQNPVPYSVAEYKNMVGRAGRLGFTETGESFLLPEGSLDVGRAWNHYITGQLENLTSKLVPDGDPRSLMLRVLATYAADETGLVTEDEVIGFLDSSFAAFQSSHRSDPQPMERQSSTKWVRAARLGEPDRRRRLGLPPHGTRTIHG